MIKKIYCIKRNKNRIFKNHEISFMLVKTFVRSTISDTIRLNIFKYEKSIDTLKVISLT